MFERGGNMVIAGIDASTKKTGIAIMNDGKYETHVLLDHHKETDVHKRIELMVRDIWDTLDKFQPDVVRMEESMMTTNIDVVKKLSNLAGAVWTWCIMNQRPFVLILPTAWRKAIGLTQGKTKRDALKVEAMLAVKQEYGLEVTDDAAEAILVARSGFDLPKIVLPENDDGWVI